MKTNKNGVKLLAAIMVFAMAFAGIVVASEENDAATTIPSDALPIGPDFNWGTDTLEPNKNYKLTGNVTVGSEYTIPSGVTIYGNNYLITLNQSLYIQGTVTFNGVEFKLTASLGQIWSYGEKLVLIDCTFSGDAAYTHAVYIGEGSVDVTGTNFNGKKLTLTENASLATIKTSSNLNLNLGISASFDPEDTAIGYVKVDLDSTTAVDTIRVSTGTTVDFNDQTIVTKKLLIQGTSDNTTIKNATLTAENISGYGGNGKVKMDGVTLVGKNTVSGVTLTPVDLTVNGEVYFGENGEIVNAGGKFTFNNTAPGSNALVATGNAKGDGWELKGNTLTLNGYEGSNIFDGTFTELILVGENTITVDADESALVPINSSALANINTLTTGDGSLSIKIDGENAGTAIVAASNLKINGVTIDITVYNTADETNGATAFYAIGDSDGAFASLDIEFSEISIDMDDTNNVSCGFSTETLKVIESTVGVTVPGTGLAATSGAADSIVVASSKVTVTAGKAGIIFGATAKISNGSVIIVDAVEGYAFQGGLSLTQGTEVVASSMMIDADTTNYSTIVNNGNMVIASEVKFTNNASFTNNGVVGVYGQFINKAGETVNNGEINTYGYVAAVSTDYTELTGTGLSFTNAEGKVTVLKFSNVTSLADGTFSLKVIYKIDAADEKTLDGKMTYSPNKIKIDAIGEDCKVSITLTYSEGTISKFSIVVTAGELNITQDKLPAKYDNTTIDQNTELSEVLGYVDKLSKLIDKTPEEDDQYVLITGGKVTNNGKLYINNTQTEEDKELLAGSLVNAGTITFNKSVNMKSGTLTGDAITLGQDVSVTLNGTVDISFIYAGEYTYKDDDNKDVTVTYDNQISVNGYCKGVEFSTNKEDKDAEKSASLQISTNGTKDGKSLTVTIVKGKAFVDKDNDPAYAFSKDVVIEVLSGATFQADGQIDVGDGVLAAMDGSIINIKGEAVDSYGYGKLVYVISFVKDGCTYYGNLAYALANATEGMTLTLNGAGEIKDDLTVGKGITLQFAKGATLSIVNTTKKITISMLDGASFVFTDGGNSMTIAENTVALVSGTFTYDGNTVVLDKILMNADDNIGCDKATKTEVSDIKLKVTTAVTDGTVTAQAGKALVEMSFDKTTTTASKLVIAAGATVCDTGVDKLKLLDGSSAIIDGTLLFNNTYTSDIEATLSGEGNIAIAEGKAISLNGKAVQNITVTDKDAANKLILKAVAVDSKDVATYKVTITSVKNANNATSLTLAGNYSSGTIQVVGNAGLSGLTIAKKAVLEIPADAVATVLTDSTVKGLVKVAGTINMKIAGDSSTITYAALAYDITYTDGDYTVYTIVETAVSNASAGDSFTLTKDLEVSDKLEVPSGVTIIVPEDYKIVLGANAYIILGSGITTLGATGGIQGTVQLTGAGAYVIEFADATIDSSKMKIAGPATTSKIINSQVTVLNVLYATVYAVQGSEPQFGEATATNSVLNKLVPSIEGYRFVQFTDVVDVPIAASDKVGSKDVVADMIPTKVQVTFQKVDGITYYVNNVKQNTVGAPVYVNYGATVTAVADYGYSGTPLVNGKAYITVDNTTTTIVGSGVSPAEPEPTPEPEKDDGMGITDYLLIVLVILAAVLVVIVAIRMMRS